MERIRTLSTIAIIIMLPMLIYYPYEGLGWNLRLSFFDPGAWTRNNVWVDPDAQIATVTCAVFFTVWAVPTLLGFFGYLSGF